MQEIKRCKKEILYMLMGVCFFLVAHSCSTVREGVKIVREFDELVEDHSIRREIRKEKKAEELRRVLMKNCRNRRICTQKRFWGACKASVVVTECQDKYGKWQRK